MEKPLLLRPGWVLCMQNSMMDPHWFREAGNRTEESRVEGGFSIMTTLDGATASETRWFLKKSVSSLAHFKPDSTRSPGTSELLKTSWVQAEYAAEGS